MNKTVSTSLIITFLAVCVIALSTLLYMHSKNTTTTPTVAGSASPTPTPSQDTRKTYANNDLGFSVKYPSTWFEVNVDATTFDFQSRSGDPVTNNDLRGDAQLIILTTTPRLGLGRTDLESNVSEGGLKKTVISTSGDVVLYAPSKMTKGTIAFVVFVAKGKEMLFMTDTAPTDDIATQQAQVLKDMATSLTFQ